MKILMIHNYYQQRGGEDGVFEFESALLKEHGNDVDTLIFHNDAIQSPIDKLKLGLSLVHNSDSANKLKEKIRDFQPDVIHIHNFFPLASPALMAVAKQHHIPVVMTLHNYRLICPNALLFRDDKICEDCVHKTFPIDGIIHGCYRDSKLQTGALAWMTAFHKWRGTWQNEIDCYITLTEFARRRFMGSSLNLNEKQLAVKPNFVFDSGDGNLEREPYCLFVGRLSREKGIDVLLEAFKNTSNRLKIIGGGPYEAQVKEAAERCKNIEYLGFQEKPVVLEALKKASALIFPSIWYEGFPMTLAEALSTGTAVIVSKIGGLSEIIEDGYNGLHIQPGNSEELREKVSQLLVDTQLQKTFGKNARNRYLEKYTPDVNYESLMAIYQRIIESKKAHNHA